MCRAMMHVGDKDTVMAALPIFLTISNYLNISFLNELYCVKRSDYFLERPDMERKLSKSEISWCALSQKCKR